MKFHQFISSTTIQNTTYSATAVIYSRAHAAWLATLNAGFIYLFITHGQLHNNLTQIYVLAFQVQIQMTEGTRQVWNYEKTTSIRGFCFLVNRRDLWDLLCEPKVTVKTECQSVYLALAGPCLLTLKSNNFVSTLVKSNENINLGICVQVQAPLLTMWFKPRRYVSIGKMVTMAQRGGSEYLLSTNYPPNSWSFFYSRAVS